MKPKDSADIQFAARLVLDELVSRALMQQVLQTQTELIERGKPMTVAQICVAKKWLSRAEARLLLAGEQAPSDLVEGFTILQRLGTGGMSQVFLAEDKESGEEVALKVLKPHLARRTTALERFRREAELLIRFDHANIVKGFRFLESDGLQAVSMEAVPGRELLELIDEGGAFQEDAALYVVLQTARALTHMYDHGVVHRDVKPGNILITADNTVKLCDLGLASQGDEVAPDGTTVGTVEYISPEQAMGEGTVDVRSDIYALGVTLYHLVVGEIPFKGVDDHETMAKRFVESLSSPKLARVSPHVHYFIQKMMATDPDIRYQSPDELIQDFEESIRGKKTLTANPLSEDAASLELKRPFEKSDKDREAPIRLKSSRKPGGLSRRRRR
ncbi:MAG: serine/threonine protein kinase [Planctomycetes bacterium]|nr:serine/threonine protein kinase [Planctomycetota bacterium]